MMKSQGVCQGGDTQLSSLRSSYPPVTFQGTYKKFLGRVQDERYLFISLSVKDRDEILDEPLGIVLVVVSEGPCGLDN